MPHLPRLFIFCFLLVSLSSFAQYFTVTDVQDSTVWHMVNVYPHISSKRQLAIADSINFNLIHEVPGILKDTEDIGAYYVNMVYNVVRNDKQVLCILMTYEACGSYCETYNEYYTYDSKTGKRIEPEDWLTDEGMQKLLDSVYGLKHKRITDAIGSLRYEMNKSPYSADTLEQQEILDMYSSCVDSTDGHRIGSVRFEVSGGGFTVIIERCSPHALRALDSLWEFSYTFRAKAWRKYLSDYGRHIFRL
jgi:hypothetical protein